MAVHGLRFGEKVWRRADDEKILRLYQKGLSLGKIGVAMSVTKNVIAGRLHRLRQAKGIKAPKNPIPRWGNRTDSPVKGAAIVPRDAYPLGTFLDDYPELGQFRNGESE